MNREGFVRQVDVFFDQRPCEDARSAKNAIIKLYDFVESKTKVAEGLGERNDSWSGILFVIQQTMSRTPLRLFWHVLAQNESLIIRSCAKGNIAESTGEYLNDPEIGIISMANLAIMFNLDMVTGLQSSIEQSDLVREAHQLWVKSTQGLRFSPMLRVHTFDPVNPTQEPKKH